ncbi:MAG: phenylalanyl-tRNA ligase subunit beta PheT [Parcubacteria group bacterium Gr01-1014_18]|nr:MAG: phenylalanyl-tRNA ligase subunit beta PheT [Parcubacteria group bacterium Greene0416_36]TSC80957.1 MAG: phenylalanyl-tRNA ligase subunit beta PheT [Parcubacteria group bacterium Gr01-1014_18]TSC98700.1 MAG: phenylalanyl-tRNA ligase subunit beta PheT [Parcubacteria group bacterium Greene1014_20]TSD06452.1 MAG: phenylalanyl-tRNA ligase subunit beta PheT [Parcubacteria group bacterium Greene0714_2]
MIISLNWLKNYVDIPKDIDPSKLASLFLLHTAEIEKVVREDACLDKVVVARIERIEPHPNADKLKLCFVEAGQGRPIQIVCGASNVYVGMWAPLALVGARVSWHGEKMVTIEHSKIRGVESEGMLSAPEELLLSGLFKDDGIIDLGKTGVPFTPGQNFRDALSLDDVYLELDNKSVTHRPDLWGHYGLARDVATFLGSIYRDEAMPLPALANDFPLSVKVDDSSICSRYMSVAIDGITVGESPWWLKKAVMGLGYRSINNIVDLTNYVMWDVGHPLHAYDLDKTGSGDIHVRWAKSGEKIVTLDGKERELNESMVVVATPDRLLLLGGIMGGKDSEIGASTRRIILESATFDPAITRRTGVALGLRTDACIMYEKTLDPERATRAMMKFITLLGTICPGARAISNTADIYNHHYKVDPIFFSPEFLASRVGIQIEKDFILKVLHSMGFGTIEVTGGWRVTVPSWRATKDISISEDLVEEISRMYGYDNIPLRFPEASIQPPADDWQRILLRKTRDAFVSLGYSEVYNYSFCGKQEMALGKDPEESYLRIENPVSKEHSFVRRSLIPGLIANIEKNYRTSASLSFFEIGKTFIRESRGDRTDKTGLESLPLQETYLGLAVTSPENETPFFALKGALAEYWKSIGVEAEYREDSAEFVWNNPPRTVSIWVGGKQVGYLSEFHPVIARRLGIPTRVGLAHINMDACVESFSRVSRRYKAVSLYPTVELDLAIVVDASVTWKQVSDTVLASGSGLVRDALLFDVYSGDKVESGKKSFAFHVHYLSSEKTLTLDEAKSAEKEILEKLEKGLGAVLRT